MEVPLLPVAIGGIVLTFALAVLGWWIASRVERRRAVRRAAATHRRPEQRRGARRQARPPSDDPA